MLLLLLCCCCCYFCSSPLCILTLALLAPLTHVYRRSTTNRIYPSVNNPLCRQSCAARTSHSSSTTYTTCSNRSCARIAKRELPVTSIICHIWLHLHPSHLHLFLHLLVTQRYFPLLPSSSSECNPWLLMWLIAAAAAVAPSSLIFILILRTLDCSLLHSLNLL